MAEPTFPESLARIFSELLDGAPVDAAYVLNAKDPGLLKSLDRLSAEDASATPANGGASIAAHVDHLRYGLELLNRWSDGEQPSGDADWAASWDRLKVSEKEWAERRAALHRDADRWRQALLRRRVLTATEQNGVAASVVNLAYHMGAIRQINRTLRGPGARESADSGIDPDQLG